MTCENWSRWFGPPGSPRLHRCLVVWMDVLGISERIKEAEKDGQSQLLLRNWYGALEESRAWLENKCIAFVGDAPPSRFIPNAFSDNILLVWPITHGAKSLPGQLLDEALPKISRFQRDMTAKGFFVRGAIVVGEIFVDGVTIFGPALIHAVELEKFANTPRIILHESALTVAESCRKLGYISAAADGWRFVNYLCGEEVDDQTIKKHADVTTSNLRKFQTNMRIWNKYRWVAEYHNRFCDSSENDFSAHKIDLSQFNFTDINLEC